MNTVLFILSTMALSSWLSSYIKNAEALSGVANVYGLGTCFLGGVFIPRNIMPAFVSKIACFTPTYWFVQNNNLIGKTVDFNINFFQHFAPTALIILAFTVAFWTLQVCGQRLSKSHN
ncbi:hypothetical protein EQ500_13125 [Lactobacillus sp. XV13L]|nr:hypothetical protein [Lactobacillus sp. XV13L]